MQNGKSDPSFGSTSNSTPESVKQEAEDLANDVLQILDKYGVAQAVGSEKLKGLMIDFSIYMVNRDQRILRHGIDVGRNNLEAVVGELEYQLKQLAELKKGGCQESYVDYMIEHATKRKESFEKAINETKAA